MRADLVDRGREMYEVFCVLSMRMAHFMSL